MFLLPGGLLLTIVDLSLVSLEAGLLSKRLLAGLADKQSHVLVDCVDVPVEMMLVSEELATVGTLVALPLLVDHSAVAEKSAGLGEGLVAVGTDHWLPLILLDNSLGARDGWHLGLSPVHPALGLAGELSTIPA